MEDSDDKRPLVARQSSWPGWRSRRIVVEPLLVLYVAAGFPLMSIKSQFLYDKVAEQMGVDPKQLRDSNTTACDVNHSDPFYQTRERVQAETANWNMYIELVGFLPAFVLPIVFGAIGDSYGRKFMLVVPCIGSFLTALVYMAIVQFDLPVYYFLLGSIENLFGGLSVIFAGAFAYLSDTVRPEKRPFRMTVIDVVSLGNAAIANLFVGYWIKAQGYFWPLLYVAVGKAFAVFYAIFFVPESIQISQGTRRLSCKQLKHGVDICIKDDGSGRRVRILLLLAVYFIGDLISGMSVTTLFEMNAPLCWDSVLLGYYEAGAMLVRCLAMLLTAKFASRFVDEAWQVFVSKFSAILEYLYMAFVSTTIMMYFAPILGCLSFLSVPMIRAILSRFVRQDEQASLFAIMAALFQLSRLVSSVSTNKIYAASLLFMDGFTFLMVAALNLICLIIAGIYIYKYRGKANPEPINDYTVSVNVT